MNYLTCIDNEKNIQAFIKETINILAAHVGIKDDLSYNIEFLPNTGEAPNSPNRFIIPVYNYSNNLSFYISFAYPLSYDSEFVMPVIIENVVHLLQSYSLRRTIELNDTTKTSDLFGRDIDSQTFAHNVFNDAMNEIRECLEYLLGIQLDDIDYLSVLQHEQRKAQGDIVVSLPKEQCSISCIVSLEKSHIAFNKENIPYIRKILSGVGRGALIVHHADGTPQVKGIADEKNKICPLFRISIIGPHKWSIYFDEKCVVRINYDRFLVGNEATYHRVDSMLYQEFGRHPPQNLLLAIESVMGQNNGGSVIVIDQNAKRRLNKLTKHRKSVQVKGYSPTYVTPLIFQDLAMIDGSLIFDIDGHLLHIATLVDGLSCIEGDLNRGSRYNSIKNFVASLSKSRKQCCVFAAIRSSDGMIDYFSGKNI